ncbi:MAG: phosphotransferase [Bacteroidetes bacterium]|nr:phosphotransferase [Bacteroidota bacterium]
MLLKTHITDDLVGLFEEWSGVRADEVVRLPPSGSYRQYYRIMGAGIKAIGAYNSDKKENTAFIRFTRHFISKGLPVPELYDESPERDIYLLQDLGNTTLFNYVTNLRKGNEFPEELTLIYRKVLDELPKFQILAGRDLDYSVCYPRAAFDKQSMMWDLHYFKYYFLKLAKIPFHEQELERDFNEFTDFLLRADCDYFLYRDFQTRNVMLFDGEPYFIDYQGGRKGALHYDVASLLYQAKAAIPVKIRDELVKHYIKAVNRIMPLSEDKFMQHYYGYVLIRMLQAMGAYGFRGFYERKEHFLTSIPFVLKNASWILQNITFPVNFPALHGVLEQITVSDEFKKFEPRPQKSNNLHVKITSFSYKSGYPEDDGGHGGGFVFDCRALPNPGKYEEYKSLTGEDEAVKIFLEKEREVFDFLTHVYSILDQSVDKYIDRGFEHLSVNFGCTGGQHRSVYCAEMLSRHLSEKYKIHIDVVHNEKDSWGY